jgi:hypothetical protein
LRMAALLWQAGAFAGIASAASLSPAPVEQGGSSTESLPPQSVRELPGRPATVADALPLVPGVVRRPGGGLVISGSGEHRSAMIVNSADVTDPAYGYFFGQRGRHFTADFDALF